MAVPRIAHAFAACMLISQSITNAYSLRRDLLNKEVFTSIYRANIWGCDETRSGIFATQPLTQVVRNLLPHVFDALNIRTLLDAGCGDCNWMRFLPFDRFEKYTGIDLVEELISTVSTRYPGSNREFQCKDFTKDTLPKADAVLCRDCFAYLCLDDIKQAIKKFKASGATYLIATTYSHTASNTDFIIGDHLSLKRYHPINLEKPPFSFPKPLLTIDEQSLDGMPVEHKRYLALWKLEDLPNF